MHTGKNLDILNGPIVKNLVYYILPLLLTNMLQVLYSSADMFIVRLSHVEGAIGAIGSTASLLHFILCICMGFAVGANIVVARKIGEGNYAKVRKSVHTSILAGLFAGLIFAVISFYSCRSVLEWMGLQGNILELADVYTRIFSLGIPFISITNCLISIFRAKGDTKTPLIILSSTGFLNVVMNIFFVVSCHMSVDGVAIATVLSNFASTLILFIVLAHSDELCRFSFRYLKFDKDSFKLIMTNGIPSAIQSALFSVSNIMIQSCIVGLNNTICPGGTAVLDGHAASYTPEELTNQVSVSACQATSTFVSQHYGAKKTERMRTVIKDCYLTTAFITVFIAGLALLTRVPVLNLLVDNPIAMETACLRLSVMLIPYISEAFMEVGSGVLRGLNKSALAMTITLIGACGFRFVWIFTIFAARPSLTCIYLSYPITWTLTSIADILFIISTYRKWSKTM